MRSTAHIIKYTIISAFLVLLSTLLSLNLVNYVLAQDYFTPPATVVAKITALLLGIAYANALTVGAWGKWEHYVFFPGSIAAGVYLVLVNVNQTHAVNFAALTLCILLYQTIKATALKGLFVKFQPRFVYKSSTKGIFLVFSLLAASTILISPQAEAPIDLGQKIAETTVKQAINLTEADISLKTLLQDSIIGLNMQNQIRDQVNSLLQPYRSFLTPLIAVAVFSLVQALGVLVYLVFSITISAFLWIMRKSGILKVEYQTTQQEILSF